MCTGDGLDDFVYATQGTATAGTHKVVIYNNTYGSTGKLFPKTWNTTNDGIRKIALEDMNGDGRVDLIVLAEGRVFVYDLKTWSTVPIARVPLASVTCQHRGLRPLRCERRRHAGHPDDRSELRIHCPEPRTGYAVSGSTTTPPTPTR